MLRNGYNGKGAIIQRSNEFYFDTRLLANLSLSEIDLKTYFQNTRLMDLTPEQRLLIVQGWKKDNFSWLYRMGMQIYERIFQTAPSAKALFPYVVESEKMGQDFRESRKFRAQALRFVQIMAQVVSYVEDPVAAQKSEFDVLQCLFDVGKRHQRYALDRPFSPDLWVVYETAMQSVMEEEYGSYDNLSNEQRRLAVDAWRRIANFIIDEMKKGYYSTPDDKFKLAADSQVQTGCEFAVSPDTATNIANGQRRPVQMLTKTPFPSPAPKRSGREDDKKSKNHHNKRSASSKCRQQDSPTTIATDIHDTTSKKQNMNHFDGLTIKCFKCSQRVPNTVQCKNTTEEDCSLVFPDQKAVCAKTIQRFSTYDPPWIFSQCQVEAVFDQSQLNKCTKAPTSDTPGNTIETCICLQQFCNGSHRALNQMKWISIILCSTYLRSFFEI